MFVEPLMADLIIIMVTGEGRGGEGDRTAIS